MTVGLVSARSRILTRSASLLSDSDRSRVETDLTPEEAGSLPSYDEPKVTTWHADEGGGFGARLRRAGKDLFGRRR